MTASLPARRKLELKLKLESLKEELKTWTDLTMDEPMRRHYSQVRRVDSMLQGLLSSFQTSKSWDAAADDVVLAKASGWEKLILLAHSIWDVFREKLAMRKEDLFRDKLAACDDLTWACYEPALNHFSNQRKEPPLVYLNSTWSPFLRPRDKNFEKEIVAGLDAGKSVQDIEYLNAIRKLPIPLLGLPWFQVSHLPSALLIAHEVGHAVEFDFGLTTAIRNAIETAGLENTDDWLGACSEVFADLYGCLCLGRYFAGALMDLMVADKQTVADEESFGKYPTRAFRVELAVAALTHLQLLDDAAAVRQSWETVYGPLAKLTSHRSDVAKLVAKIYSEDGMNLASVIRPPKAKILAIAQYARQNNRVQIQNGTSDARALFCAARHIYETGTPHDLATATPLLVEHIVRGYASQFRYRGTPVTGKSDLDARLPELLKQDYDDGVALRKELGLDVT